MEKFMRGDSLQRDGTLLERLGTDVDSGRKAVFHAAPRRPVREVVNEHVVVERSIVHPTGGRGCDLMQHAYDLCHVVVGGIGIHDHAIMSAALVKIGFLKVAYFYGRIDQSIIIFRIEMT